MFLLQPVQPPPALPARRPPQGLVQDVILVSSSISEREQMLFISTDEGASFQRQPVSFTADVLLFHPAEEDKLLAYSKEAKLYISTDLGHKWSLLQERVTKDRVFWCLMAWGKKHSALVPSEAPTREGGCRVTSEDAAESVQKKIEALLSCVSLIKQEKGSLYLKALNKSWAVTGVDVDPDLVHMEIQDISGVEETVLTEKICSIALELVLEKRCLTRRRTQTQALKPAEQAIVFDSKQKEHFNSIINFLPFWSKAVTTGNRTKYYVSHQRNEFVQMRFPKYSLPKKTAGEDFRLMTDQAVCVSNPGERFSKMQADFARRLTEQIGYGFVMVLDSSGTDVQIVSTDESQVFLALQEWYQTDTYNLYQSDTRGVYYSIVLENVRSTKQPEENVLIDILEVRGVKGVFLANQKVDGKVTTLITYNKGRDWELLAPPTTDMNGKPVSCKQPDCHLHLHLRWADNPYVSGTVHTKDSAPGLIMGAGNLGSQLVEYKEEMYITSDCGKTWRQVFEEEHHILYLDHGGVIVAIKDTSIPLKILKFSTDEGRSWSIHNFTSTSVFVDGLLSEPGDETLVMTVVVHWAGQHVQWVGVHVQWVGLHVQSMVMDVRVVVHWAGQHVQWVGVHVQWVGLHVQSMVMDVRQCTEADYDSWKLTNLQGEKCIMGQERAYRRRKDSSFCIKGKSYTSALRAKACQCTEKDFGCDYGFERAPSLRIEGDRCYPDFWHDPDTPPENCHLGNSYQSSTGYRKVIADVCEGGMDKEQSAKQHACPLLPPKGLQLGIKGQMLAVAPGDDITFIVHQEQGDTSSTRYQVDLMDGVRAIYENLTVTDEPIQHRYERPGVYRVSVTAENSAGHDQAALKTAPLQEVHLEVVPIAGRNQDVNLTAIVLPAEANLTVFYWWIGDNLQPKLTLENSLIVHFSEEGQAPVTVQASNGRSMVQDSKTVIVYEWRQDIGQVVTKIISKLTGVPQNSLVTVVKPGLPTTADMYVLPQESTPMKRSVFVDKDYEMRSALAAAGPGVWALAVFVLISLISSAAFILVKFKRKLPGRNVYAQMHNEKEQEMTSPVNHSEDTQNIIQGEEFIDDDLETQTLGAKILVLGQNNPALFASPRDNLQPLWGGVEHKLERATQLPDQLMRSETFPVWSTTDVAFFLSIDPNLERGHIHKTDSCRNLRLSILSPSSPASSSRRIQYSLLCCVHSLVSPTVKNDVVQTVKLQSDERVDAQL
ncbi:hypothetical protein DNTS_017627 [Danionella cerebrum]|uniref:VPS10 domain-containing receptor SorCS2 n=1 Tax=Danionella cerebrum TaxID=2873325 RepID=A0A553PE70_9TELE|nr:hypothetical protein DNTS_017627 [Danionella translucida]